MPTGQAAVTISVDESGAIFFNSARVSDAALAQQLSALSPKEVGLVRLQADERVGLRRIVEVLDIIRGSPVKSVALEAATK